MDEMIDTLDDFGVTREGKFKLTLQERADLELNDRGNALRLLSEFGDDLIFTLGKGWGVWDGARYSFKSGPLRAAEIAAKLPDLVAQEITAERERSYDELTLQRRMRAEENKARGIKFRDLDHVAQTLKDEKIGKLTGHMIKCGNVDKQTKALKAMEWQVRAEIEDLDTDPWLFTVKNGSLDLKRVTSAPPPPKDADAEELARWRADWLIKTARDHNPTKCAGVAFVPGATCPGWEDFMALIMPDPELRAFLQRCMGALLFGVNVGNAALLLRGGGGNGKSTLMFVIAKVLGARDGYAAPAKVEMFLQSQNQNAGQATPEEVELPGARAILASEPAVTDVFSGKKIKALTGGDLRPARALGMPQFIYRPTGIPVIQFNRTPRIKDEDAGLRRRLAFIPLEVNLHELPPERRKSNLQAERELEPELPGILNWMLDGLRDYMARVDAGKGVPLGIDPPAASQALKDKIMEGADPVGSFLAACTDTDPEGKVKTRDFFRAFKAWAEDNGARVFSDAALRDNLIEKGYSKGKSNGLMVFKGFAWKEDPLVASYLEGPAPAAPDYFG
jgi:P4 family phage/plasmid primase-like protien